ncbi:hypothetical protein CTER_4141, partial [Ruminiclostridium cellobioparum subsp. termitidis CT1112]
ASIKEEILNWISDKNCKKYKFN